MKLPRWSDRARPRTQPWVVAVLVVTLALIAAVTLMFHGKPPEKVPVVPPVTVLVTPLPAPTLTAPPGSPGPAGSPGPPGSPGRTGVVVVSPTPSTRSPAPTRSPSPTRRPTPSRTPCPLPLPPPLCDPRA